MTGFAKVKQEDIVVMYEESDCTNYVNEANAWLLPHVARKSVWQVSSDPSEEKSSYKADIPKKRRYAGNERGY